MRVSQLADALVQTTGAPTGRFHMLVHRLQAADVIPKGAGGSNAATVNVAHAVALLLAHLSGASYDEAAAAVARLANYKHTDEQGSIEALTFIAGLLSALVHVDDNPSTTGLAWRSSITVVSGDRPAVVVRIGTTDEPIEMAFTPDGTPWQPHTGEEVTKSTTMPGRVLFRLARALEPLLPPSTAIARRAFPFELHTVNGRPIAEWRAGVEAELAKMPVNA